MDRRQSLAFNGAEDVQALRDFDVSFYGYNSAAVAAAAALFDSDSESDSSSSDTESPLEKRFDYGSSDDEIFSDDDQPTVVEQSADEV